MIVLDTTIINVALPSIRTSLGFSETALVWVVNAYMLTFGGCLLLGGRLGDLFGHRRLFLIGLALFTGASLLCGLAHSQTILVAARALQGIGGAVVSAVALSLIMMLFTEATERTKALGVFGFVAAGGGSVGVFLGGLLTHYFNWNWIFLVNIPIGIIVIALSILYLPKDRPTLQTQSLDVMGATTITSSLMLAVYAIVNGNASGWTSAQTLSLFSIAIALFALFIAIESKVKSPLMPLSLFRIRNITVSNIIAVVWAAAIFAWFFIVALYLQFILGLNPLYVGLAFLPANIIMALFSLGISAKVVMKWGIKPTLTVGLLLAALSLGLLARSPVNGQFMVHVLPSMCLLGLGGGLAFNPMLLAAMNDAAPEDAGVASGLVNTAFMMGGAVGLAILASLASAQTTRLLMAGATETVALNSGYHVAFLAGAIFAAIGAGVAWKFLKITKPVDPSAAHTH